MAKTSYYWQGGRKIEIEEAPNAATIHADSEDAVRDAAAAAGIQITDTRQVAPALVRVELPRERDAAMQKLREQHVLHHVYCTKGHPDDEVLITDTFFVKFKPDTAEHTIAKYLSDEHLEVVEDLGDRTLLVRVTDATGRNPIRTANSAALRDEVEYAEPNLVRQLTRFAFLPADPLFAQQWHLHAPADGPDLVRGAGIDAPNAWDLTRGVRDVVVAVADDGFDLSHPDFQGVGKIKGRLNVTANGTGIAIDANVTPRAGDYHGTPCAGVAVAEQNGQGTVGVAPGCSLLAVRFPLSISDAQLARMFERIARDADVLSCSWGFGPANAPMSTTLSETITRLAATRGRRGKGLVICVAAGNNNCPIKDLANTRTYEYLDGFGILRRYSGPIDRWIAAHPDVLTVSASTSLKTRAAYSSWGAEIDVCAPSNEFDDLRRFTPPGRGITTTDNEGFGQGSDFAPGSRYTSRFGGTSSATPTVAGVCALVISRNQSLTAERVRDIVRSTADQDLVIDSATDVNEPGEFDADGHSLWFGYGKVDARAAVLAAVDATTEDFVDAEAGDLPLDIPDDRTPVESSLTVADDGRVEDLRVRVEITHTFVSDLRVDLIAPDGTAVTLHNQEGWGVENLMRTYTPVEVPGLRAFTGTSVRGTWRLRVVDTWFWDTGKIRAFRLVARTTVPAPTTVQPTARRRKARPRRAGAPAARA